MGRKHNKGEKVGFEKKVYFDPYRENSNRTDFFRLRREYQDEFWKLSNSEILMAVNIWIRNKEKNRYVMSNKELTTIQRGGYEYSFYSSAAPKRLVDKLENIGLINIVEDLEGKKYYYNHESGETNFINIPLKNIIHYVDTFGREGVNIYMYILHLFYNTKRPNTAKYGIRQKSILSKQIQNKLSYGKDTDRKITTRLNKTEILKKVVRHGKANIYYLPVVDLGKGKGIIVKTGKKINLSKLKKKNNKEKQDDRKSQKINNSQQLYRHTSGYIGTRKKIQKEFKISNNEWEEKLDYWVFPYNNQKERNG